jgi:curved DNA-binding protein CbpA
MEINEAFRTLGLPRTATPRKIKEKYRHLSKKYHPDVGGKNETMARLSEAKRTALDATKKNQGVMKFDPSTDLASQRQMRIEKEKEHRESAERLAKRVVARLTGSLRRWQRGATLFSLISTTTSIIESHSSKYLPMPPWAVTPLIICAILSGIILTVLSSFIITTKREIESAINSLDDGSILLDSLSEIIWWLGEDGQFSRDDLERHVERWLNTDRPPMRLSHMLTRVLGPTDALTVKQLGEEIGLADFTRLLISKGLGFGLIHESIQLTNGKPEIMYSFRSLVDVEDH